MGCSEVLGVEVVFLKKAQTIPDPLIHPLFILEDRLWSDKMMCLLPLCSA